MIRPVLVIACSLALFAGAPVVRADSPEVASPAPRVAPDRLALGRLLRDLDRAWLDHPEPAARARGVGPVAAASQKFFTGDTSAVARDLVQAVIALRTEDGTDPARLWAGSLVVTPGRRILEPGAPVTVSIARAFDIEDVPDGATVTVSVEGKTERVTEPLPATVTLPLDEGMAGDLALSIAIAVDGTVLREFVEPVSVIEDAGTRAEALRDRIVGSGAERTLELETARALWSRFRIQESGLFSPEWPAPSLAMLERAERLTDRALAGEPESALGAPGERWVRLPIGRNGVPCKLRVPAAATEGPRPLVLAVHGLAGSEHLWFSTYGLGLVADLAEERGWIVAAPRLGTMVDQATVGEVVGALQGFLAIDPERIFVIGHSMGAVRTIAAIAEEPARYRAVAPLSGGGALAKKVDLTGLPCFVAAGDHDFGLGMAMSARTELERAGAAVTYRLYPSADHMMMVPDSLPNVFEFFDATLEKDATGGQ